MYIFHGRFQPNLSGVYECCREIPLNFDTPRGIFHGSGESRYLVCDDAYRRFAIALKHPKLPPFTMFRLGELPVDTGQFQGVGKFNLGNECDGQSGPVLGSLHLGLDRVEMWVRQLSGLEYLQTVAYGHGNTLGAFDEWTMVTDDNDEYSFGRGR